MQKITCWDDLRPYGIVALTGKACGLSYRLLCDVTERGKQVIEKALGIPNLGLPENWNRGDAADPHIGCVMAAPELLIPLGVFALLEKGCREVWRTKSDGLFGIDPTDDSQRVEAVKRFHAEKPGAHDALSARIIEKTGFKALAIGGYPADAALMGKPDISFLTLPEMVDHLARLTDTVDIPILVDGDTGHGGVLNVARTVREFERAGAAGLFIEDQVFPKRCGHMEGKQVVGREDMVAKIKAALDARKDPDLVIMASTDALAVLGVDEAIERGNLYREAGADVIFVEAPRSVEEMRRINREVDAPTLANNVEGGKTPFLKLPKNCKPSGIT